MLVSFDMANARSLARCLLGGHAVCVQVQHQRPSDTGECLGHGSSTAPDRTSSRSLPPRFTKSQIGCVAGSSAPNQEFIGLLCPGDRGRLGRHVASVKARARARAGAANYLGAMGGNGYAHDGDRPKSLAGSGWPPIGTRSPVTAYRPKDRIARPRDAAARSWWTVGVRRAAGGPHRRCDS
jgi:hypothetical protein